MRNFSEPNCDTGNVDNICKIEEVKRKKIYLKVSHENSRKYFIYLFTVCCVCFRKDFFFYFNIR